MDEIFSRILKFNFPCNMIPHSNIGTRLFAGLASRQEAIFCTQRFHTCDIEVLEILNDVRKRIII